MHLKSLYSYWQPLYLIFQFPLHVVECKFSCEWAKCEAIVWLELQSYLQYLLWDISSNIP